MHLKAHIESFILPKGPKEGKKAFPLQSQMHDPSLSQDPHNSIGIALISVENICIFNNIFTH